MSHLILHVPYCQLGMFSCPRLEETTEQTPKPSYYVPRPDEIEERNQLVMSLAPVQEKV